MFASKRAPVLVLTSFLAVSVMTMIVACGGRDNDDAPLASAGGTPEKTTPDSGADKGCQAPFKINEPELKVVDAENALAAGKYKAIAVQIYSVRESDSAQGVTVSKSLNEENARLVTDCNSVSKDKAKATIENLNITFSSELDGATSTLAGDNAKLAVQVKDGEVKEVDAAAVAMGSNILTGQMPLENKEIHADQSVTARLYHGVESNQVELRAHILDAKTMKGHRSNRVVRVVYQLQDNAEVTPAESTPAEGAEPTPTPAAEPQDQGSATTPAPAPQQPEVAAQ